MGNGHTMEKSTAEVIQRDFNVLGSGLDIDTLSQLDSKYPTRLNYSLMVSKSSQPNG